MQDIRLLVFMCSGYRSKSRLQKQEINLDYGDPFISFTYPFIDTVGLAIINLIVILKILVLVSILIFLLRHIILFQF